ncbi:MAG: hypothetical protein Q4C49_14050 [Bacillota bacterium]|nr:hypothetical protein [Bacillota bacterium]
MDNINGYYDMHICGRDYGAGVDSILVHLDVPIGWITKDDLTITETKQFTNFLKPEEGFPIEIGSFSRTIKKAFICDEMGKEVEGLSKCFKVEMNVDPMEGSPYLFSMKTQYNTFAQPYQLDIKSKQYNFSICSKAKSITSDADVFEIRKGEFSSVSYEYATYKPKNESKLLFVWLHGLGEGGKLNFPELTDPTITVLGNRVTSLTKDVFQTAVDGAFILAPQCPTYWMDETGDCKNFTGLGIKATRNSYYTESLVQLIDTYAQEIGAEKIIIAGCSNGGYMTMNLAMNYGTKYDAYIPICEAMPDSEITDADIDLLKDCPMYFIYSQDDPIVIPAIHEEPTIQRLKNRGAKNLEVSVSDHVYDLSDEYSYLKNEADLHYLYNGHWSWIYFFNNQVISSNKINCFDWIRSLSK